MLKVTSDSHVDHTFTPAQRAFCLEAVADKSAFFIETIKLPTELGTAPCGLHGPATGGDPIEDGEVTMQKRGKDRMVHGKPVGETRMVNREPVQVSEVTVIGGPHGDEPCILFTMYAGPCAPREPWDPSMNEEERQESKAFWAVHALGM
jgi:hypothetical protein